MKPSITELTKTHVTIQVKTGKLYKFSVKNQKQLRDAVNYLEEDEAVFLVGKFGDISLKTAWRLNDEGLKRADESRRYNAKLKTAQGQKEIEELIAEMVSQPDFAPKLGDIKMGYR